MESEESVVMCPCQNCPMKCQRDVRQAEKSLGNNRTGPEHNLVLAYPETGLATWAVQESGWMTKHGGHERVGWLTYSNG